MNRDSGLPEPSDSLVGARFPSKKQRKRYTETESGTYTTGQHHKIDSSTVGRAGARFPSAKVIERLEEPVVPPPPPAAPAKPAPPPRPRPARAEMPRPRHEEIEDPLETGGPRVRPYVLTRGRTKASRHLAIEAMISTRPNIRWSDEPMTGEFHSVRSICQRPRSVAEIAANLAVPLGVARVLLGDMAELGLVSIHEAITNGDGRPSIALMERVLQGLRQV